MNLKSKCYNFLSRNNLFNFRVGMKERISKIIIFVNDKRLADRLALSLNEKSYEAFSVSSDRTVSQRLDALESKNIVII